MFPVTVIDIGIGNTHSVVRALEHVGASPLLTSSAKDVLRADRVVFPGVGAFGDCAAATKNLGLSDALKEFSGAGKPLLGLCVGMQLLLESSTEFGVHAGLGVMEGQLDIIPSRALNGDQLRVPHIGWSDVHVPASAASNPLFIGFPDRFSAYFVHSYAARRASTPKCCGWVNYGGYELVAAVSRNLVFGVQFHPEKSAAWGLKLLQNFVRL